MKQLMYLFILCVPVFILSCGDDDDSTGLTEETIDGRWNLDAYDNEFDLELAPAPRSTGTSQIINSTVIIDFDSEDDTWTSSGAYTLVIEDEDGRAELDYTDGVGSGTYTVREGKLTMIGFDAGDNTTTIQPVPFETVRFNPDSEYVGTGTINIDIEDPVFNFDIRIDGELTLELSR